MSAKVARSSIHRDARVSDSNSLINRFPTLNYQLESSPLKSLWSLRYCLIESQRECILCHRTSPSNLRDERGSDLDILINCNSALETVSIRFAIILSL